MALTLPASIQDLVGNRVSRVATSYDRTRFFIDIPRTFANSRRSRYAYRLVAGEVSGSHNLAPLIGGVVLSVSLVIDTGVLPSKLIFTTNPTGSKVESSILYLQFVDQQADFLLQEQGDAILLEDDFNLLLEDSGIDDDAELLDLVMDRNAFQSNDSETKFFIIQEDDF